MNYDELPDEIVRIGDLEFIGKRFMMEVDISFEEMKLIPKEGLHRMLKTNEQEENYEACVDIKLAIDDPNHFENHSIYRFR